MNKILQWYGRQNIYIKLFPFLVLYLLICIRFSTNEFGGDEGRYVMFANNLLHGFYSPPYPDINLWCGPGYSIVLMPLVFFKLPYLYFRLLNSFFLYFSLILTYKTLASFSTQKKAFFYTVILGLYYPIYLESVYIVTESLGWFLISLNCFLIIKCFQNEIINWKILIFTAFTIAYLAMTKIIFGYVIFTMIFVSLFMFLSPFYRFAAKKASLLFIFAFIFCLPWLFYTYSLTSKVFYWTNCSSMSLYTMSSPDENELGDWEILQPWVQSPRNVALMDSIQKLKGYQVDDAFKDAAILNIKKYPKKYFTNWLGNIGRLLFSMPFSNVKQNIRQYYTILPNMFLVVIMFFILLTSISHYKKFPESIVLLFVFFSVYFFGSSLVSAYRRMFYITMPFWVVLISYFFNNIVLIKIRNNKKRNDLVI